MKTYNIVILTAGTILLSLLVYSIGLEDPWTGSEFATVMLSATLILAVWLLFNARMFQSFKEYISNGFAVVKSRLFSGPILSIFIAAITGFIGYNITAFLSRDKVSVQDVSVNRSELKVSMSPEIKKVLEDLNTLRIIDYKKSDKDDLSEKNVIKILKLIKDQLELYKYYSDIYRPQENRDSSAYNGTDYYTAYNDTYKRIDSSLKIIIPEFCRIVKEHKNDYKIDVVLYNSGDKQAIVKNSCNIYFDLDRNQKAKVALAKMSSAEGYENYEYADESEQRLASLIAAKLGNSTPSDYVYIQPKSFNTLSLFIKEKQNIDDVEESKRILINGMKKAKIEVTDIVGTKMVTGLFDFKFNSNRNELEEYLIKNFKPYISATL